MRQASVGAPARHKGLRCTAIIGAAGPFSHVRALEQAMQQPDATLYRGKAAGCNRIEWAGACWEPLGCGAMSR